MALTGFSFQLLDVGVTASFTQRLDAASDLVTLIPTVILGAEVLGSEVGFVSSMLMLQYLQPHKSQAIWKERNILILIRRDQRVELFWHGLWLPFVGKRLGLGATLGESLSSHRDEVLINGGYCFIPPVDIGQKFWLCADASLDSLDPRATSWLQGQVSIPSSRSCDGCLNMLSKKLAVIFRSQHWLQGVTASFTQPLDATSDLVTLIPTVILGAEVLGSEVGFVFVKSNYLYEGRFSA
ncbi:hypothetical protein Cgig2_021628 [Carnegiea gigantea]|uniref:Uncharacterized protein n=1 Tax=Carnegiea gigantea TaxID=171969 RepID=A0A9Q1Q6S5_9CARY|nr:hypothetical protein Cgig2_021628 [Carnegiea gigantea]